MVQPQDMSQQIIDWPLVRPTLAGQFWYDKLENYLQEPADTC